MRYIGRHRAPRPIYLRRPVVGGVLVAALVAVPALAVSSQGPGLLGGRADPSRSPSASTSASNPAVVVPTDGPLPSDTPATSTSDAPTSATTTSRTAPTTTPRTTTPVRTTPVRTTSRTPSKSPTPPAVPAVKISVSAPAGTVGASYAGSVTASGGTGSYSFSSSGRPPWLSFVSTGKKATFVGTPTASGAVSFSVTVRSGSRTAKATVSFTVAPETPDPSEQP